MGTTSGSGGVQAGQTRTPPHPMGAPTRGTAMPSRLQLHGCGMVKAAQYRSMSFVPRCAVRHFTLT